MKVVPLDLDYLKKTYFYFDKPVDYKLRDGNQIKIYPISVENSEIFLSSINLLTIDKNSLPNPQIIQMSYLQFICDLLINDVILKQKFINILSLCLHINHPFLIRDDLRRPSIIDQEFNISINHRDFDDIKKIILYQNLIHYDDEYIDPDFKKAITEVNELQQSKYETPNIERKIAIISAHTGILKQEQMKMTLRSHSLLFEEVNGEIDFITIRPIALFSGKGNKLEHWIYKNRTNKFDKYITPIDDYKKSIGNGYIKSSNNNLGDIYMEQFNNFNK